MPHGIARDTEALSDGCGVHCSAVLPGLRQQAQGDSLFVMFLARTPGGEAGIESVQLPLGLLFCGGGHGQVVLLVYG